MIRPIWSGTVRLGDLSIPVTAYAAIDSRAARTPLRQLHEDCSQPIRLARGCSEHGEIPREQIVKGFEHTPGRFIALRPAELDALQSTMDSTIALERFISPQNFNPLSFAGRGYYLLPDSSSRSRSGYAALRQALSDENLCGLAEVSLRKKKQLVMVRPTERLLTLTLLHYADVIRPPEMFATEATADQFSADQLAQARRLIRERHVADPRLEQYRDPYRQRLAALIERKLEAAGRPATEALSIQSSGQNRRGRPRSRGTLANGQLDHSRCLSPRRKAK